jgi:16S rRNA (uracil1498-N3)-methyltransferase
MHRLLVDAGLLESDSVMLPKDAAHHLKVLRPKPGETVELFDGAGRSRVFKCGASSAARLVADGGISVSLRSPFELTLFACVTKGSRWDWTVEKAVELGVKKIVVFSSEYSSAYMNDNKLSRLNKVSIESAKQCGRAIAPEVVYAENFELALKMGDDAENKLFACEFADKNCANLTNLKGSCSIVIGSEGGFSKEESELAFAMGYQTVFLGKRILRAETASIVLTGIVMHSLGELE